MDVIRYEQNLKGTKIGCREGDCGACTILIGELIDNEVHYRSVTSCLMALATVDGKHVVTVEGVNMDGLNPFQQAMADEGATQCGFCTPGFIMSLAGFVLSRKEITDEHALASIDGNICRCTGYKSIERATRRVVQAIKSRGNADPLLFAVSNSILPSYFSEIKEILQSFQQPAAPGLFSLRTNQHSTPAAPRILAGGTDLYVQDHEKMEESDPSNLISDNVSNEIKNLNGRIHVGPGVTVSTFFDSPIIQEVFPHHKKHRRLISSTPIRNMATIAGNFINASPIGDLTIFFLALNANIELTDINTRDKRILPLSKLYKGYKQLDRLPTEFVTDISFVPPSNETHFHFEKVSKRTHLDIASVNTAIHISLQGNIISVAKLSAGGVSAIPLFLERSSQFLTGKEMTIETIRGLLEIIKGEISPISDARGSKEYKILLLLQLVKAHFIQLFPSMGAEKILKLQDT